MSATTIEARFAGNDNYGQPKADYLAKVKAMDRPALLKETEHVIWLAAYAANNPRADYHWQTDALWAEWVARGDQPGYEQAYKAACRSAGVEA